MKIRGSFGVAQKTGWVMWVLWEAETKIELQVQSQRIKRRGGPQAIRSTASERKGGKGDWEGERHTASLCSLRVFKGNRESLQRLPVGNPMMGRNVPALAPGCASQ